MVGVRQEHRGQAIEGDLVVRLGVVGFLALLGRLHGGVVRHRVIQGEGQFAAEQGLVDPHHGRTDHEAEFVHETAEVAGGVKLFVQPRTTDLVRIRGKICRRRLALQQRLDHGLSREHAAFHRGVVALDLYRVQGAGIATDKQSTREMHGGQGVVATFGNSTGAIADA